MGIFSNTWNAVTGKVSTSGIFSRSYRTTLWTDTSIDYTRNDYDLYRSLYYGVSINGKAKDMLIGSMLSRKIVNTTAGFTIGQGFSVGLEEEFEDVEQEINNWTDFNEDTISKAYTHAVRDGDGYLYIDEYGNLEELDAKSVSVILDPVTGVVIGYDVEEKYELEVDKNKTNYVIVKQYRTDSVKYTRYKESDPNRDKGEVIYNRVYTSEGAVEPKESTEFLLGDIIPRPLPIVHFVNDQEPRQTYGNSELLNCLMGIRNYTAVITNATKGVINNSNPIPVFKGVKNAASIASQSNKGETEDTDKISWNPDTILFLENPESSADYIQASGFMDDTGKLMEYYFYLILEASETPEFVFGTAVSSSKASVSEQMPVLVQKIIKKRTEVTKPLRELVEAYVDRKIRMSDQMFMKLKNKEYDIEITFPDMVDEDKRMTLDTVRYLHEAGIITDKTATELLMAEKISDIDKELKEAKVEGEARAEAMRVADEQQARLLAELESDDKKSDKKGVGETTNFLDNKSVVGEMASKDLIEIVRETTDNHTDSDEIITEYIQTLTEEQIAEMTRDYKRNSKGEFATVDSLGVPKAKKEYDDVGRLIRPKNREQCFEAFDTRGFGDVTIDERIPEKEQIRITDRIIRGIEAVPYQAYELTDRNPVKIDIKQIVDYNESGGNAGVYSGRTETIEMYYALSNITDVNNMTRTFMHEFAHHVDNVTGKSEVEWKSEGGEWKKVYNKLSAPRTTDVFGEIFTTDYDVSSVNAVKTLQKPDYAMKNNYEFFAETVSQDWYNKAFPELVSEDRVKLFNDSELGKLTKELLNV